jgi:hypothetical protein
LAASRILTKRATEAADLNIVIFSLSSFRQHPVPNQEGASGLVGIVRIKNVATRFHFAGESLLQLRRDPVPLSLKLSLGGRWCVNEQCQMGVSGSRHMRNLLSSIPSKLGETFVSICANSVASILALNS